MMNKENLKISTREENLKKINDELEKLSDDELEKVAGGNILSDRFFEKFRAGIPRPVY